MSTPTTLTPVQRSGKPSAVARRTRYLDLMREHGHIVKAEPGQDHNLPCGWPGNAHIGSSDEGPDSTTQGQTR